MRYFRKIAVPLILTVCFLMGTLVCQAAPVGKQKKEEAAWPAGPKITSEGGVLLDEDTGAVLYGKNIHKKFYPASTTKIMTALVALENCSLNETVTFSKNAIYDIEPGSSIIGGVDAGDKMSMKNCLYGLMLSSGNEAAYAIAEHVGGSMPEFVKMMNAKAKELGCSNTHFMNPHGLHNKKHYTTPYDLALIMKAAWKNADFRKISGTVKYTIPADKYCKEKRVIYNHNKMLPGRAYGYEGVVGGKTGYTSNALSTLVVTAEKKNMTLITVVMRTTRPYQFTDAKSLLDFGFSSFRKVNISRNESEKRLKEEIPQMNQEGAACVIDSKANLILPKGMNISDTEMHVENEKYLTYQYKERKIGSAHMHVLVPDKKKNNKSAADKDKTSGGTADTYTPVSKEKRLQSIWILGVLGTLLIGYFCVSERERLFKHK